MKNGLLFCLLIMLIAFPISGQAQEVIIEEGGMPEAFVADSTVQAVVIAADSVSAAMPQLEMRFKPDPNRALIYAIVPGLGQIYNRKYWKLPIVYGAFMGCLYAITWNNRNYQDYKQAYLDILSSKPMENDSWVDFLPGNVSDEEKASYVNNQNFINNTLRGGRDSFRRYRDMSILITIGVYAISLIDAYVDAQLFDFDISPDLSMRVEPVYTPKTSYTPHTYGVNCSIKF